MRYHTPIPIQNTPNQMSTGTEREIYRDALGLIDGEPADVLNRQGRTRFLALRCVRRLRQGVEVDGRAAAPSRCHAGRGTTLRDSSVAFATISVRIGEVDSATTRDNQLIVPDRECSAAHGFNSRTEPSAVAGRCSAGSYELPHRGLEQCPTDTVNSSVAYRTKRLFGPDNPVDGGLQPPQSRCHRLPPSPRAACTPRSTKRFPTLSQVEPRPWAQCAHRRESDTLPPFRSLAAETGNSPERTAMKKVGSDALRNLPVVGTLLGLVAIAALGLAYWGNVTSRERYLQSRNFRLLGDVAEQTQTMLYDSEQIVRRTIHIAARAADASAADGTRTRSLATTGRIPTAAGQGDRGPMGERGHLQPAARAPEPRWPGRRTARRSPHCPD